MLSGQGDEVRSFLGSEALSFQGLRVRGMRLKYASIVQIKNVDMLQEDKYLSKWGLCTDQAVKL